MPEGERVKLSDLIIEHGPYEPGEVQRGFKHLPLTDEAALNELREELIAARCDRTRFRVYAVPRSRGSETLGITHDDCPGQWHAEVDDFTGLDELCQRAREHVEVCS